MDRTKSKSISGLRIQDAACLARSRLKDDKLFLYTQKTGTPVNCPLPPETVDALEGPILGTGVLFGAVCGWAVGRWAVPAAQVSKS